MRSMTGFGKGSVSLTACQQSYDIEILSVNRRQLELRLNMPPEFNAFDQEIRALVAEFISRGAVNLKISVHAGSSVTLDFNQLRQLAGRCIELRRELKLSPEVDLESLLNIRELYNNDAAVDLSEFWPQIRQGIRETLTRFNAMREREGANLHQDLTMRLAALEEIVEELKERTKELPAAQRVKLMEKLEQAGLPVDLNDERLLKELLFYADKCDVTEELTRLSSHFVQFKGFLGGRENCGRSLDFLIQEIFREINTLGNKSGSCNVSPLVVKFKSELEKIREQVQNIE
ncbi:MAG: YicC family protein [Lentisphaeria bacterium]|nr:YicC family protein [Lentisphaeria bacterium]